MGEECFYVDQTFLGTYFSFGVSEASIIHKSRPHNFHPSRAEQHTQIKVKQENLSPYVAKKQLVN